MDWSMPPSYSRILCMRFSGSSSTSLYFSTLMTSLFTPGALPKISTTLWGPERVREYHLFLKAEKCSFRTQCSSLEHLQSMESLFHPPRCVRQPLLRLPSAVEQADVKKDPRNRPLPTNLLPLPPELLESVSRLCRVRAELSSSALHWTHSLSVWKNKMACTFKSIIL